jgi:hypothetical protein
MSLDLSAMAHEIDAINKNGIPLKPYLAGQTYNGVLLQVTGVNGFVIDYGIFIPQKMSDGSYWLYINIVWTSNPAGNGGITIAGITFYNTPSGNWQYIPCMGWSSPPYPACGLVPANNNIINVYSLSSNSTNYGINGTVRLQSKPTWMD